MSSRGSSDNTVLSDGHHSARRQDDFAFDGVAEFSIMQER
jgi:hypothetical protein